MSFTGAFSAETEYNTQYLVKADNCREVGEDGGEPVVISRETQNCIIRRVPSHEHCAHILWVIPKLSEIDQGIFYLSPGR